MLKIVSSTLLVLALAQTSDLPADRLKRERAAAYGTKPLMDMVSVQAVHLDGTPAVGTIRCNGYWFKFDEKEVGANRMPFVTDSRGVAIFNPWTNMFVDDEGESHEMVCDAMDRHGHSGTAAWYMPRAHAEILVR